jgi:DegV family protein with EDD domain
MSTAIVTESTCDIPYHIAKKFDIHVVPNIIVIQGKSFEDDEQFSRQDFCAQLPDMEMQPTTSTASSGVYKTLYAQLLQESLTNIVSIHASSVLSGIYNAARLAAQDFENKVRVLDSQQVSMGLGFQVLAAAEAVIEGLPLEAILQRVESIRGRTRLVAMLDTLEYIHRSGRVSWARARLGSLLRIKPFVEVLHGEVQSLGEVRTRRKGIDRLRNLLQETRPFERLAILHSNAEDDATHLLEDLSIELPTQPLIVNVTTVIGTHVGPNALGFVSIVR